MAEGKTLGAKQVATRIGTDAKTFRKFLRQTGSGVGQGRRYDFPEADIPELGKEFHAWLAKSKAPKTKQVAEPKVDTSNAKLVARMKLVGEGADLQIVDMKYDPDGLDEDEDAEPTIDQLMELVEDNELDDLELDELDDEEEED